MPDSHEAQIAGFSLGTFFPQVLTFCLCMLMHIRSKHVWGFFLYHKTFFARNLRYLNWYNAAQSATTFSSEVLDILYSIYDFIAQTLLWARKKSGKRLIPANNYLVHVLKYSPMFTYHFQVRRSKRRAAEDLRPQDDPAVAVTGDRPKRAQKLTPRGQAFVERVLEVSHQHSDESAGPSHSRQDMVIQLSAGGHVNQQPAQLSAGGFSPNHHQPAQLFAGGPHQNPQLPTQMPLVCLLWIINSPLSCPLADLQIISALLSCPLAVGC